LSYPQKCAQSLADKRFLCCVLENLFGLIFSLCGTGGTLFANGYWLAIINAEGNYIQSIKNKGSATGIFR
jgi:hypothetical protein